MRRRDEQALAERLDLALDGHDPGDAELAALAAVLERAAAPARFDVSADEVDDALAQLRTRPRLRRHRPRPRPLLGAAVAFAAAAALAAVILTRSPGIDVEGNALAALGGPSTVLRVVERIEPGQAGALFPTSVRVGWLDPLGGRARWTQWVGGRVIAETLLERGRVSRYVLAENAVIVGTSCRAFASGCAELVDPITLYRRALQDGARRTAQTTYGGRPAYVLTLPVQSLPDALRIEQRVTIDRRTYLPRRIEWVNLRNGRAERPFAVIVVRKVKHVPRAAAESQFQLPAPPNVRVVQRVAPGRGLRKLGERRLLLPEARTVQPRLRWLGPAYVGLPATLDAVRWNAGTTYRVRYGPQLTVWNYGRFVPPEIAAARYVPAKTIPLPGGRVMRFYSTVDQRIVAEVEGAERSVALTGPNLAKIDFFRAAQQLRPLR